MPTCTLGWIEKRGTTVQLVTRAGAVIPIERVSFQMGAWGFAREGVSKIPRPREYNADGSILNEGDMLIVNFPDGNPTTPLVSGGFRSVSSDSFLPRTYDERGDGYNRLAMRVAPQRGARELGRVELEVAGDNKGSIDVSATDDVTLDVGGDVTITIGKGASRVTIKVTGGVATIDSEASPGQPAFLGRTMATRLAAALTEIVTGLASPTPFTATTTQQLAIDLAGSTLLTKATKLG
jgi:hypothetical protein